MGKVIFHVDVNSAFLSWTSVKMLREGSKVDLRKIPAAVGGDESKRHGVVLAKSEEAKKYGIHTGESLFSARKKCPFLEVVPPDFEWYVRNSKAMMEILSTYTPDVYQYSIDEAFLDMTGMELLMGSPLESANRLQNTIRDELGFTVNIGISSNFLLAKMASDFEKPDKIHTLFLEEIQEKMWPLPVSNLFSVGRSARRELAKMGAHTIGDLANLNREMLLRHLGIMGGTIWDYANGIESTPIAIREAKDKSYGSSMTTSENLVRLQDANQLLLSLVETVAARIRLDKKKVSVVSVNLVDSDFKKWSRQRSLGHNTDTTDEIYTAAKTLLAEAWNDNPIRLLGVSAGKAIDESEDFEQMSLFQDEHSEKMKKLDKAVDSLRGKFGDQAVMRASLLGERKGGLNTARMKKKREEQKGNL
ncbi:MAG TPA: DNA polymerase IV [Candidatus Pelethocola excrementipullorum]|nr:DNA polymerase IV [Candidatus Pelethocola excrementipullorum]